jgi:hypothetical protein
MFNIVSSCPITSSISNEHQLPSELQKPGVPSANSPNLTWTSRTQNKSQILLNSSSAVGDHVVVNATFPDELNVTHCELKIWNGFTFNTTRPLVIPTDPSGVFDGIVDPAQFDWIVVGGLESGIAISITCNFTTSDVDFMAWPDSICQSEYTYANNLLDMASGDKPEHDKITLSENGNLTIGCLNYCGEVGTWTLHLEVGARNISINNCSSVVMDTYYLSGTNSSYNILAIGYTNSNKSYTLMREDVTICNFFAPEVTVYAIEEIPHDGFNCSWSCSDKNADDVNYYSLWLSNNDGLSFVLLAQNLTRTWYVWNSSGWLYDDFIFGVRAYSLDFTIPGRTDVLNPPSGYWPGDFADGFSISFQTGDILILDLFMDVGVFPSWDIEYLEGESGNSIVWTFYFYNYQFRPSGVSYTVYRNDTLILEGTHNFSKDSLTLSINVDGLSQGNYNYTLYFRNPGRYGGYVRDVVIVTVGLSTSDTSDSSLLLVITVGIPLFAIALYWKHQKRI